MPYFVAHEDGASVRRRTARILEQKCGVTAVHAAWVATGRLTAKPQAAEMYGQTWKRFARAAIGKLGLTKENLWVTGGFRAGSEIILSFHLRHISDPCSGSSERQAAHSV
jgi:hypothetical protein